MTCGKAVGESPQGDWSKDFSNTNTIASPKSHLGLIFF